MKTILNICLVPDPADEIATSFANEAITYSKQLNGICKSYYELDPLLNSSIYSKPHCTLTHVVLTEINENQQYLQSLRNSLISIIGQPFPLTITGVSASLHAMFSKKDIIEDRINSIQALAYWLVVKKSLDLVNLQKRVIASVEAQGNCITACQEYYEPHFTLWANTIANTRPTALSSQALEKSLGYNKSSFVLPCKIAVGNCGPHGQVRDWVTDISRLRCFSE
ncbi:hypothetical protein [Legionella jamestowniensis]|uniref:Uncharacterized protein n=1 Tax=Legionella jamestowniensis TaxID=455 RepID=A0A0W0UNL4_9GAMM|nr:hypothetical protein [Legionella jamestowniensis]KTD09416.1 hypothetical protein Ljam_0766 [Legionella jamestowniensis]OCH99242.1 hypothetical protein A8135_08335 [Legionella jamestowniensis]SFL88921.1 hypothetical protein SAMN02746073_2436 [Legionella jamestowniensis DSM 19215]